LKYSKINVVSLLCLFLVLHSKNYLKSDYCREELNWFHQYNKNRPGGLSVGKKLRVFNILLNNIPHLEWPEALKALGETLGFPMHDAKGAEDLGDFTSIRNELFEKQLRKIVDAVEVTLEEIIIHSRTTVVPEQPAEKPVNIFVAYASDPLQPLRDRLIADIGQTGAEILDDIPPPMESAEHRKSVEHALSKASFSIHLLDQWPGRKIIDQKDTTYPRQQAECALISGLDSIIWVPGNLSPQMIEDESQRDWLSRLEKGKRENSRYEFVRSDQTALIELVLQKIFGLQIQTPTNGAELSFLIDTHQKDQRYAYKLATILADRGVDVEFNKESRDPIQGLDNFDKAVRNVRNLIIMSGRVAPPWLQGRIKRAVKIVAEQFEADAPSMLENIWVYLTPESEGPIALPRLPPVIHVAFLDNSRSESIDPQVIARLLASGNHGGAL
jgi:hypothetical protein